MKKIVICIIMICALTSITIFANMYKDNKQIETEGQSSYEEENKNPILSEKAKSLDTIDFSVSDEENKIILDSVFSDMNIDESEIKSHNNYVGEVHSGKFGYKVYTHHYADFDIYVSNLNYNIKNRNFDEYYITQITLKNSRFKTYRGITIGTGVEEIIKSYGCGAEYTEEGKTYLTYTMNDMKMQFTIDEDQKVTDIVMYIIIEDN